MTLPDQITSSVADFLKTYLSDFDAISGVAAVSGGSINSACRFSAGNRRFFIKYNDASRYPAMFEKEAAGLELLRKAGEIDVPEVIHVSEAGNHAYLLMSYIDSAAEEPDFWQHFGKQLAALHSHKAEQFGLDHSNYMGSLSQSNRFHHAWKDFFVQERLEPQIRLARENGEIGKTDVAAFERFFKRLDELFPETQPSLVHGDLWSGNFMVNNRGKACLIDPAAYYGHPEVDIAMSTLFGGFSSQFYDAYCRHNPLEKGWRERLDYYNLYPLMVHVNLFGQNYLGSVRRIINKF